MAAQAEKATHANGKGANPKKDPAARRRRSVVEKITVPSVLNDEQRQEASDNLILQMLANIEQEEVRLDLLKKVNKAQDTDLVPGEGVTFKEAVARLKANREQIAETCGDETMQRIAQTLERNNS